MSIVEDLSGRSVASLLAGYAAALAELKRRGVVRFTVLGAECQPS